MLPKESYFATRISLRYYMLTVGINGSPRKTGNTARLIEGALQGARDAGSNTELINLYDLDYKGCRSCLSCKRKESSYYGRCALKDDLAKVLEQIREADVLILGSPIYYGAVTGEMRSFLERLLFPYMDYAGPDSSLFQGNLKAGFIYTMGMPKDRFDKYFRPFFEFSNNMISRDFGNLDILYSFNTVLTVDHGDIKVETQPEHGRDGKNAGLLADRIKAYEFGKKLATQLI
jgi:multimeric flavodoxin WrbA